MTALSRRRFLLAGAAAVGALTLPATDGLGNTRVWADGAELAPDDYSASWGAGTITIELHQGGARDCHVRHWVR